MMRLERKLMTQRPDLLQTLRIYYYIPAKSSHVWLNSEICPSDVDLSCQSDVKNSEIWQVHLSMVKTDRIPRRIVHALMPWSVKSDTCQMRLAIFGPFWQSAHPGLLLHWRETNPFFPPSLPPPLSGDL